MGWSDWFFSKDESGKQTKVSVKTDDTGAVTDMLTDLENDAAGGRHGHVWGLGPHTRDSDIGGREGRVADRAPRDRDRDRENR